MESSSGEVNEPTISTITSTIETLSLNENAAEIKEELSTETVLVETVVQVVEETDDKSKSELKSEEAETSSNNWARQVSNEEEQKLKEIQDQEVKQSSEVQIQESTNVTNTNQDKSKKKGRKKKEIDPAQTPRNGYYFEHDNREDEIDDENNNDKDKKENVENITPVLSDPKKEESTDLNEENKDIDEKEIELQKKTSASSKKPLATKKNIRSKVNLNNINQKYGNRIGKTNFRKKKQIEIENSIDDDAKWSHDRFDSAEQQPKSKTELVKRYGYDIRDSAEPDDAEQKDFNENVVVNEKKSFASNKNNQRKVNSSNDASKPKDSNVKPSLKTRLDFSSKIQQTNPTSGTRSYLHQKDRIINNSSRKNVNNTSENNKNFNANTRKVNSNQNQIDLNSYHDNNGINDDDDQYYEDDEEENDEHERLNIMRKNNGENDYSIGDLRRKKRPSRSNRTIKNQSSNSEVYEQKVQKPLLNSSKQSFNNNNNNNVYQSSKKNNQIDNEIQNQQHATKHNYVNTNNNRPPKNNNSQLQFSNESKPQHFSKVSASSNQNPDFSQYIDNNNYSNHRGARENYSQQSINANEQPKRYSSMRNQHQPSNQNEASLRSHQNYNSTSSTQFQQSWHSNGNQMQSPQQQQVILQTTSTHQHQIPPPTSSQSHQRQQFYAYQLPLNDYATQKAVAAEYVAAMTTQPQIIYYQNQVPSSPNHLTQTHHHNYHHNNGNNHHHHQHQIQMSQRQSKAIPIVNPQHK